MSGNRSRDGRIKVVIIKTQHVQTDAADFKSVVQKLTGKDSEVPDSPKYGQAAGRETGEGECTRNLSFKELDWLIKEMPDIQSLDYLWNESV